MDRIPRLQEQFATLVPEMAHSYPFELDVFQKEVSARHSLWLPKWPPSYVHSRI